MLYHVLLFEGHTLPTITQRADQILFADVVALWGSWVILLKMLCCVRHIAAGAADDALVLSSSRG